MAVRREVHMVHACAWNGQRTHEVKGVRVAEVESMQPLGDDDCVASVDREVEVVRIVDGNRFAGTSRNWIDRRQGVPDVVVDVQRLQVVRRCDVLRQRADREVVDDLVRGRVDHVDGVARAVRYVDARRRLGRGRAEHSGVVVGIEVEPPALGNVVGHHPRLSVDDGRRLDRRGRGLVARGAVPDQNPTGCGGQARADEQDGAHLTGPPWSRALHRGP